MFDSNFPKDIKGNDVKRIEYVGKVLLIVNVDSKCGLTNSNYKELNVLYEKYREKGFRILAFPCNQFVGQEPGSNEEIEQTNRRLKSLELTKVVSNSGLILLCFISPIISPEWKSKEQTIRDILDCFTVLLPKRDEVIAYVIKLEKAKERFLARLKCEWEQEAEAQEMLANGDVDNKEKLEPNKAVLDCSKINIYFPNMSKMSSCYI
ncbi:hypothetical protein GUJ93_ZPchr0015g6757 [Zizania palustris]|uniref:Glutathione peroxidase n=1 Tax=Zizania palustris TaxID=103762 RepID=A0A8J5SYL8_ZIZPA|nr:hypothetical protein GUJ93_ZPchr0015g6757 [Zizania palustris]